MRDKRQETRDKTQRHTDNTETETQSDTETEEKRARTVTEYVLYAFFFVPAPETHLA
jgi:hypothetical protein